MTAELPLGLAMALSREPEAMQAFCALTEEQRKTFSARAHSVTSKEEMRALAHSLVRQGTVG